MTTPDAVVIGGRTVATDDHGNAYLAPGQVAERLGVALSMVSRWPLMREYGALGPYPYPAWLEGQHVTVNGRVLVLTSALDAWVGAVAAGGGRSAAAAARWAARLPGDARD